MTEEKDLVVCASNLAGKTIIGMAVLGEDGPELHSAFMVEMVRNSKTGERYFSFAPTRPLKKNQNLLMTEVAKACESAVFSGFYEPEEDVAEIYRKFINDEDCRNALVSCYLQESGPVAPTDDCGTINFFKKGENTCQKNVITGVFPTKLQS